MRNIIPFICTLLATAACPVLGQDSGNAAPTPETSQAGPEACSSFVGRWDSQKLYVQIASVDSSCVAKLVHASLFEDLSSADLNSLTQTVHIKDGKFSFTCGGTTITCYAERRGDDLWLRSGSSRNVMTPVYSVVYRRHIDGTGATAKN